jgi:hypothetical protein
VESEGWGLELEGGVEILDRVLRCALAEPGPHDLALAQQRVRSMARRRPERAWAARLIAPSSPGLVAPDGSDEGAASVVRAEAFLREARGGARITVAIVGDAEADAIAHRAARALGSVPSGGAVDDRSVAPADVQVRGEAHTGARPRVVIAWSARTAPSALERATAATAARAFAAGRAEALRAQGLDLVTFDGGAGAGLAWAFVSVDVDESALPGLPGLVARTRRSETDVAAMSRALRWATGDARRAAGRLARQGSLDPPLPDADVVRALSEADAAFAVGREEPGLGLGMQRRRDGR